VTTDDDRIAYLAGDREARLHPDDQAGLENLRDLLSDPAVWVEPEPSLRGRVMAAIAAEVAPTADHGPRSSSPQADRAAPGPRRRPSARTMSRRRRIAYVVAGVAAAVAAVVISVSALTGNGGNSPRFTAALAPSSAYPSDATGTATLTQTSTGWRVHLQADGLPRLDNGQYYQAWLRNSAGISVTIGTFNQGPDVTLWSGVSPKDFPTLTVTAQEANGDPASSGHVVLIGNTRQSGRTG
jgi:hypothetical protein